MAHQYLNLRQLSKKLGGRSRTSLYRDISSGRLPAPVKFGGRIYFEEGAVDEKIAMLNAGGQK